MSGESEGQAFEPASAEISQIRPLAFSIAYRMLGSVAEAEDVVQEALLRLHRTRMEGADIESPKAFVAAVATRMAIDHLRSARARRESYFGEWLPEPVVEGMEPDMAQHVEMSESLSMAFLLILETLSPVERAVFLLREVFDYEYEEIGDVIGKEPGNCRQIFARAKKHIDAGKPRFEPSREKRDELAQQFFVACQSGELSNLVGLLASDAAFYGDGGGKATATLHPVQGRDRVARLVFGLFEKGRTLGAKLRPVRVNGQPGAMIYDSEDRLVSVFSLEIADGAVQAIRSVVNPDKLSHLGAVSDIARIPNRRSDTH